MVLSSHAMESGRTTITATVTASNRSSDLVEIRHPSGCPIWYGLFDDAGKHVAGGPAQYSAAGTVDLLSPSETRSWTVEIHSCYLRVGDTGSGCEEGASVERGFHAAAGLNTGDRAGVSVDKVWYAPSQPVYVSP